jgi:hypothetical protein
MKFTRKKLTKSLKIIHLSVQLHLDYLVLKIVKKKMKFLYNLNNKTTQLA